MPTAVRRLLSAAVVAAVFASTATVIAQRGFVLSPEQSQRRWQSEQELQTIAVVDRKVMMRMRDGVRLATDIYRPKNVEGTVPTIFVRTPYNFNYWDVQNGVPRDMSTIITAVKRG
ncbi:MAG: CocE/NonD family hydrolase, partial [Vicinamibacterales bacterium]|nr:CocE/NonD family hydrolase [Vicinamibacterales bacterium]